MNHSRKPETKAPPHPGVAGAVILVMALLVALVSDRLGLLAGIDARVAGAVGGLGLDGGLNPLPPWVGWLWLLSAAGGMVAMVLHVSGNLRRFVLVATLMVLHFSWVPILALCGRVTGIAPATVGLLWAAICSLTYAVRHREPE